MQKRRLLILGIVFVIIGISGFIRYEFFTPEMEKHICEEYETYKENPVAVSEEFADLAEDALKNGCYLMRGVLIFCGLLIIGGIITTYFGIVK